jgi:hypothetical protein
MARTATTLLTLAVLGLGLGACQPHYDGLEIRYINGVGELDSDGFQVREGQAIVVEVTPLSDNPYEDYEAFDIVELTSANPNVLVTAPSTDVNRFVLIGVLVGQTVVDVEINGRDVDTIDAKVVAQNGGGQ